MHEAPALQPPPSHAHHARAAHKPSLALVASAQHYHHHYLAPCQSGDVPQLRHVHGRDAVAKLGSDRSHHRRRPRWTRQVTSHCPCRGPLVAHGPQTRVEARPIVCPRAALVMLQQLA